MSMLAERKVKQKWSLNPRGKAWSEDSNKFGQKMLEKMGWAKGKGLGAKENGMVEHVSISYKNDSKGMGYKESSDQWTQHDANFNQLLASLSGETETSTSLKVASLEKKSQSSKVRVHYKKFTRGKDLSRYSEKDLANIFGKKSFQVPQLEDKKEEEEPKETFPTSDFVQNKGSMADYFKKKNPLFNKIYNKHHSHVVGNNGVLQKEADSDEEVHVGFGFQADSGRKRKSSESSNDTLKKQKCNGGGVANPAFDPLHSKIEVQRHELNPIQEETVSYEADSMSFQEMSVTSKDDYVDERFEVKRKKSKKRKSSLVEDKVEEAEVTNGDEPENESMNTMEVKRKKKKNLEHVLAIDNPNFDDHAHVEEEGADADHNNAYEVKRKKKKSKADVPSGVDNPNFTDATSNGEPSPIDSPKSVCQKKKKNRQNQTLEQSAEHPIAETPQIELDLMLNITSTPVQSSTSQKVGSVKRRKSVRFSDVTHQRIIPNNEDIVNRNELFDINSQVIASSLQNDSGNVLDDSIDAISRKIDGFQAEIENDMNEQKMCKFVGDPTNPEGENEQLPDGVKLKFKYAKFTRSPSWLNKNNHSRAKSSYKHLIKGDIVIGFKNTNLHEISGYGSKKYNMSQ